MEYNIIENRFNARDDLLLENSIEKLLHHSKNKSKFKKLSASVATKNTDMSDYTSKSLRRSHYLETQFYETQFVNSAAAGSQFMKCKFDSCKFQNANFQECTFSGGIIKNNIKGNAIVNCNFNHSLFSEESCFKNIDFHHSVFQETAFIQCNFQNVTFFSCTLQDTIFSNVQMENITFSDLNIDYSSFSNVTMHNVILPFSQICYSFGLLSYLMSTNDEVYITSSANSKGVISVAEFLELLPEFEIYYTGAREFFPLANIYLAQNKLSKAREAIMNGILLAINTFDLRQIKYLSKLIYTYSVFDFHQRKQIYDYINSHISFYDMSSGLLYKYNVYKNEIRSFLMENNRSGIVTCEIDILTNIYPEEALKLGTMLSVLEEIIDQGKSSKSEHSILCRHNSPVEILVTIQDVYQALTVIVPAIYSIIMGVIVLDEKINNRKIASTEVQHMKEMKELEIQEKRLDVELKKIQLKKEKTEFLYKSHIYNEKLRRNIIENKIQANEIRHITYGDIPHKIDKRILQYSQKNNDSLKG